MSIPAASAKGRIALVMGVANRRSIAWNCVESLASHGWKVIFTYQNTKLESRIQPLLQHSDNILGAFPCDVVEDIANKNFAQRLADTLQDEPLGSLVHSLAYAPNLKTTNSLLETTLEDYVMAQQISAYSLIDIARETQPFLIQQQQQQQDMSATFTSTSSITALTYLGAVRAIPGYNAMGPAKASLESIVRGLAVELAPASTRVNAVSAGPLPTVAAKGGIQNFDSMRQDMAERAPLGNVTAQHVADTVTFLASASGITGQTIYVDGGYSIVGGPPIQSTDDE